MSNLTMQHIQYAIKVYITRLYLIHVPTLKHHNNSLWIIILVCPYYVIHDEKCHEQNKQIITISGCFFEISCMSNVTFICHSVAHKLPI